MNDRDRDIHLLRHVDTLHGLRDDLSGIAAILNIMIVDGGLDDDTRAALRLLAKSTEQVRAGVDTAAEFVSDLADREGEA